MTASTVANGLDIAGRLTGRYTRISDDTEHEAKGTARQDGDEIAYIEANGGIVGPPYEENDTSAYKKKRIRLPDGAVVYRVIRPVWQRMLADLRAGKIQAACVADLDRLARDPRDLEDAIELVEHYRRPVVGVKGGFDLVTDNGRFAARILVAQANKASADTAARVARKHLEQQQNGVPTGSRRAFGWKADKRTLEPAEAVELRWAVERIISGWPSGAVVVDWNRRGQADPVREVGTVLPGRLAAQPPAVRTARPDREGLRPGHRDHPLSDGDRPAPGRHPGGRAVGAADLGGRVGSRQRGTVGTGAHARATAGRAQPVEVPAVRFPALRGVR